MGWFTDLIDRIDAKLDRPADQTMITNPRKRRSMRMLDQMTTHDESRPWGANANPEDEEPPKVRPGARERGTLGRWFGGR